ncbi:hypothetical protein GCM10010199_74550 [Dactylosporangium roseum]
MSSLKPLPPIRAGIAGNAGRHAPPAFAYACRVAVVDAMLDARTITTWVVFAGRVRSLDASFRATVPAGPAGRPAAALGRRGAADVADGAGDAGGDGEIAAGTSTGAIGDSGADGSGVAGSRSNVREQAPRPAARSSVSVRTPNVTSVARRPS